MRPNTHHRPPVNTASPPWISAAAGCGGWLHLMPSTTNARSGVCLLHCTPSRTHVVRLLLTVQIRGRCVWGKASNKESEINRSLKGCVIMMLSKWKEQEWIATDQEVSQNLARTFQPNGGEFCVVFLSTSTVNFPPLPLPPTLHARHHHVTSPIPFKQAIQRLSASSIVRIRK